MSEFLGIDLIAGLNKTKTRAQVNNTIRNLQGQIKHLKLDLKIDKKALGSIRELNRELKNLSQVSNETGKRIRDALTPQDTRKTEQGLQNIKNKTESMGRTAKATSKEITSANKKEGASYRSLASEVSKYNKEGQIASRRENRKDPTKSKTESYVYDSDSPDGRLDKVTNNHEKLQKDQESLAKRKEALYNRLNKLEIERTTNEQSMAKLRSQVSKSDARNIDRAGTSINKYAQSVQRQHSLDAQRRTQLARLSKMELDYTTNSEKMSQLRHQVNNSDIKSMYKTKDAVSQYGDAMKRQQSLQAKQLQFRDKISNLESQVVGTISPDHQKRLRGLASQMANLSPQTSDVTTKTKLLNSQFSRLHTEVMQADQGFARFSRQMASAMVRIPIYAAGMAAMYAPIRVFQDAISQTINIDSQLTVLERVSDGTIKMNDAMEDSIAVANKLGNSIEEVNDGLINFARQGFRGDDLSTMTEYATVMSNISDLDVEDSASSLTAAMKGFNVEAEDSLHIVDALNEVDNNYSITTAQLAESLQKSAGSASAYGSSLENVIGYSTAIGEVTRESGRIIGKVLPNLNPF